MPWIPFRTGLIAAATLGLAGCDRLNLGPPTAEPAPVVAPALESSGADPALRGHAGEAYAAFIAAAGARYAPDALGLGGTDRERLQRAMAASRSEVLDGGGAEALVFRGCAEAGCAEGVAIVAVDLSTGLAFVGVKDSAGAEVFRPNDRIEALLRLNSPTRSWDNPEAPAEQAAAEQAAP